MSKTFSDVSLIELIPSSISGDLKIQGSAAGSGQVLSGAYQNIPLVRILSRIDELPAFVLDLLGWQFHVDYWDAAWSLEQRRGRIKDAINWHRHKGTPGMIEQIWSDVLGIRANILEWYEYQADSLYMFNGEPYHFHVQIDADHFRALTGEETRRLFEIVRQYKNTRSWLDGLAYTGRAIIEIKPAGGGVSVCRDRGQVINHIQHTAQGQPWLLAGAVSTATDYARAEYSA